MSFVAVQHPTSAHSLGRGPTMVEMARPVKSWIHHERGYYASPTQPSSASFRLPPASNLVSPPLSGHSPHTTSSHPLPLALTSATGPTTPREQPYAVKTHYHYNDTYGTPSPVQQQLSPQLSGPHPPRRGGDPVYVTAPRRTVADNRKFSPTQSSTSSSEDQDSVRLRHHQQLAAAVVQQQQQQHQSQTHSSPRIEPLPRSYNSLALQTRSLPPPASHVLASPAGRTPPTWSPRTADSGSVGPKMKISNILSDNTPSPTPLTNGSATHPFSVTTTGPSPRYHSPPPISPAPLSRPPSQRTSTSIPHSNTAIATSPTAYKISVCQQPVAARSCGFGERDRRVIDPPPIVQLSIVDSSLGDEEVGRLIRHPYSVIHCTIWDSTGSQDNSAMPEDYRQQRRLMGTLVASPFVGLDENGKEGCFFCFPDLSCRTPGQFRLKFSLVVLDPRRMRPGDSAKIRATAMSDVFTVYNAKDFPGMQASTKLTKRLKEQGCLISIKKGNGKGGDREESEEDEDGEGGVRKKRVRRS